MKCKLCHKEMESIDEDYWKCECGYAYVPPELIDHKKEEDDG